MDLDSARVLPETYKHIMHVHKKSSQFMQPGSRKKKRVHKSHVQIDKNLLLDPFRHLL
jgi:hypothetical protein